MMVYTPPSVDTQETTTTENDVTTVDANGKVIAHRKESIVTVKKIQTFTVGVVTPPTFSGFAHPGCGYSAANLAFTTTNIGNSPWSTQFAKNTNKTNDQGGVNNGIKYSDYNNWSTSGVVAQVGRGSGGSPSEGDKDMFGDGMAALLMSLMWKYQGVTAAADKAVDILNAWSSTCTLVKFDQSVYSDGLLLSGWVGSLFARAGEILRAYPGYTHTLNVTNLKNLFKNVLYPNTGGATWGTWKGGGLNWLSSMIDATVNMGVFCDDQSMYQSGRSWLDQMIPAWAYLVGDVNKWPILAAGNAPISNILTYMDTNTASLSQMKTYWKGATSYVNGLWGEICRDFHHTAMGYGVMVNALETCWIQGDDLYGAHQNRIVTSAEKTCKYYYDRLINNLNPPPGWVGPSNPVYSGAFTNSQNATWEILYNHYAIRKGVSMPNTLAWLTDGCRSKSYTMNLHMCAENTTHRDNPS